MSGLVRLLLAGCSVDIEPRWSKSLPIVVEVASVHVWDPQQDTDYVFTCAPADVDARLTQYAEDRS